MARLVRGPDRVPHPGPLVERPQQRRRLDRGEDQVEPGDGGPLPARFVGPDLLLLGRGRLPAGLLPDHRQPRLDPRVELLQRLVGGERPPQPGGGDGLVPHPSPAAARSSRRGRAP